MSFIYKQTFQFTYRDLPINQLEGFLSFNNKDTITLTCLFLFTNLLLYPLFANTLLFILDANIITLHIQ